MDWSKKKFEGHKDRIKKYHSEPYYVMCHSEPFTLHIIYYKGRTNKQIKRDEQTNRFNGTNKQTDLQGRTNKQTSSKILFNPVGRALGAVGTQNGLLY